MRLPVFSSSLLSCSFLLSCWCSVPAFGRTPSDFDDAPDATDSAPPESKRIEPAANDAAPNTAETEPASSNEAAPNDAASSDTSSGEASSEGAADDERPVSLGDAASSETSDAPPPVFESSPSTTSDVPARRTQIEPDESKLPTPFDRNGIRVGVMAGWAGSATTDWFVLGAGLGYFVLDGLEVHADTSFWLGGNPFIATVTPGVRYVFHQVPQVKPYVGVFYRHYFVDRAGFDSDSIGGRAGLYFTIAPQAYFGGGIVYERLLDDHLFRQRDQVYPEITLAFTF